MLESLLDKFWGTVLGYDEKKIVGIDDSSQASLTPSEASFLQYYLTQKMVQDRDDDVSTLVSVRSDSTSKSPFVWDNTSMTGFSIASTIKEEDEIMSRDDLSSVRRMVKSTDDRIEDESVLSSDTSTRCGKSGCAQSATSGMALAGASSFDGVRDEVSVEDAVDGVSDEVTVEDTVDGASDNATVEDTVDGVSDKVTVEDAVDGVNDEFTLDDAVDGVNDEVTVEDAAE